MDNADLLVMVGRIDERTVAMDKKLDDVQKHLKKQDDEIDSLKKFRYKFAGGVLSLSTAASLVVAWFSRKH